MLLYPVILISFGFVFVKAYQRRLPRRVALPFAVNLLFMPIFAGLRSVPLAAADIMVVWATILWCVVVVWRHYRWVAVAQVPLAPPCRNRKMRLICFLPRPTDSRANTSESDNPMGAIAIRVSPPSEKKSRRVTGSEATLIKVHR